NRKKVRFSNRPATIDGASGEALVLVNEFLGPKQQINKPPVVIPSLPDDVHRTYNATLQSSERVNSTFPDHVRVINNPACPYDLVCANVVRCYSLLEPIALRYKAPSFGKRQDFKVALVGW